VNIWRQNGGHCGKRESQIDREKVGEAVVYTIKEAPKNAHKSYFINMIQINK